MTSPAHLKKITLNLARTKEFPDGSTHHGYDIVAPLDSNGHIDAHAWRDHRNACVVYRYWGDEQPMRGRLIHKAGGNNGATWCFDYDASSDFDDEAGYRFGNHAFVPGEYVSIADAEGELHTFKVTAVKPA